MQEDHSHVAAALPDSFKIWLVDNGLEDLSFVLSGAGKGFLLYFGPMVVLKRRIDEEIVRRSCALAAFTGCTRAVSRIFKYVDEYRRRVALGELSPLISDSVPYRPLLIRCIERLRAYPRIVQGIAGGTAALMIDGNIDSAMFVLWLLVRTIKTAFPYKLPAWVPVFWLCLSSSHILSSWITAPDELDPNYLKFLNYMGSTPVALLRFLGGPNPKPLRHCEYLHPQRSCHQFGFWFWKQVFAKSVKLYAPLHVVLFAMSKRRSVLSFFVNLTRSVLFLTSYCTLAICFGCFIYRFKRGWSRASLMSHTWVAGLPVFLERPGRRVELSAYVTTYALDSLYRISVKKRLVRERGHPIVGRLTLVICAGILLHHAEQLPPLLSQWLLGITSTRKEKMGEEGTDVPRVAGSPPPAAVPVKEVA